jgi:flagellar basal-body rod protein FlgG
MEELNTVANNLANVNTNGFKRETTITKAFPEMLARRLNDDGLVEFPLGSYDLAPVIGKLGTGVEFNESYVVFEQGSLQGTENDFDFALEGDGFFSVLTDNGERYTRNGAFTISNDGFLVDKNGNYVLGENGFIQVGRNNFQVDQFGNVYVNRDLEPDEFTSKTHNEWTNIQRIDRLKIVDFRHKRYLEKEGHTLYRESEHSGSASVLNDMERPKVYQGFVEKSNINPVYEMTRMIEIQRLFEANQKSIQTADETLGNAVNQVMRGLG